MTQCFKLEAQSKVIMVLLRLAGSAVYLKRVGGGHRNKQQHRALTLETVSLW